MLITWVRCWLTKKYSDNNSEQELGFYSLELMCNTIDWKSDINQITPNTWLSDTGSSCHMTNSKEGMFDCSPITSHIKMGNGKSMTATLVGKKRVMAVQKDGTYQTIILNDVKFIPGLWVNLFAINKALEHGFKI